MGEREGREEERGRGGKGMGEREGREGRGEREEERGREVGSRSCLLKPAQ